MEVREREISTISAFVKSSRERIKYSVVALSQLNRAVETRTIKAMLRICASRVQLNRTRMLLCFYTAGSLRNYILHKRRYGRWIAEGVAEIIVVK
jgi:replicative DNA helicase